MESVETAQMVSSILARIPSPEERKGLRVRAGLTQEQMAAHLGVVVRTFVARYENPETPSARDAAKLVKYAELLDSLAPKPEREYAEAPASEVHTGGDLTDQWRAILHDPSSTSSAKVQALRALERLDKPVAEDAHAGEVDVDVLAEDVIALHYVPEVRAALRARGFALVTLSRVMPLEVEPDPEPAKAWTPPIPEHVAPAVEPVVEVERVPASMAPSAHEVLFERGRFAEELDRPRSDDA